MSFCHLHVHSHYSLLDGLTKIPDLVKAAKKRGFSAVALTDHGVLYGAIEFYKACKKEGINPIIGCEIYVAPTSRFEKDSTNRYHHLVLLAENYTGYKNLMKLSSFGFTEGFYYKPRVDKELLRKYSEGIISSSACFGGEIAKILRKENNFEKAKEVALEYQDIFGKGNFFLEMMDLPALEGQMDLNDKLIELSKATGIPLIVTRDSHYLNPDDGEAQDILTCIRDGRVLDEPNRPSMQGIDFSLATEKEISSRFKHIPEAIHNTGKIADRVNIEIELDKWHFPPIPIPKGKTADEVLQEEVYENIPNFMEFTPEIKKRADYELDIIKTKGYSPYFLAVAEYVNFAKDKGIVETTRGSGAGSLVSYSLGITTVDPIYFKLPFERFLNPFRPSPPDIDTDFADDRRHEVIEHMVDIYGKDKVAHIITFGTMQARGALRDVGRALGFSYSFCDQVSKLIPFGAQGFNMNIAKAMDLEPDFKKMYKENPDVKRLVDLAMKVEGCARHTSMHAAGVVISPTPLTDFMPVQLDQDKNKIVTQYEFHSSEAAGVLKMDFLGIRNLSILGHAVEIVKKTLGEKIDIYNLPLDNKKTYDMLARGETVGVFQLSGSGMTKWLKEMKPNSIHDIMAIVALFRPGPMESIPEYIRRKQNPELVKYPDPRLKDILEMSYGLLVYQDDVMLTAIELAGYNWFDADKFRKAMGKKIPEEMARQKIKFYEGCKTHGKLKRQVIDELWTAIEPFAAYGFNKCLVGGTEIVNPKNGSIKTIKELFEEGKNTSVLSLGKDKKLISKSVPKIYKNGVKQIYKIKTRTGREIEATDNHPFLKFSGWNELKELQKGDLIAVPRKINYQSSAKIEDFKLKVLGYLLSEGNLCHPHGAYYYSSKKDEIKDFIKAVKGFKNINCKIYDKKKAISVYVGRKKQKEKSEINDWLKEIDVWGKNALQKTIPDFVFKLPLKSIAILIGSLWQGDGCVHNDKNGQIYYATSSEKLAKQLQHLLLRFKIISTIHKKKFKYRGGYKIGYTVNISRYNNIKLFSDNFLVHLLGEKKKKLKQVVKDNKILNGSLNKISARGTKDIIPSQVVGLIREEMSKKSLSAKQISKKLGLAERLFYLDKKKKGYTREVVLKIGKFLKNKELIDLAESEIYWDVIVEIKKLKKEMTYDLTVPKEHNFIADDFVVHNSHAASYGIVAYQTAYMKANYPIQYMTAVLIAESGDMDKVPAIIHECGKMDIEVLPPDVNHSFKSFAMIEPEDGGKTHIRFGLSGIKNVGENISEAIYRERKENGKFKDLEDFLSRVKDKDLNKRAIDSLAKCGAMDCFGIDRGVLIANIESILAFVKHLAVQRNTNQSSLFANTTIDIGSKVTLALAEPATEDEKLVWEKELLGLYVSSHPFKKIQKELEDILVPLNDLASQEKGQWVIVGGMLDKATKKITRKGSAMMFAVLQDLTDNLELLVFPKTYETTKDVWVENTPVIVIGKTSEEEGDDKLFVEKAYTVTNENIGMLKAQLSMGQTIDRTKKTTQSREVRGNLPVPRLELVLNSSENKEKIQKIKDLLSQITGDTPVFIKAGDKIIKTSYKIDPDKQVFDDLAQLAGEENLVLVR